MRSISTQNVTNKPLYIAQFTLIVLAPVLMAAACYVVFVCFRFSLVICIRADEAFSRLGSFIISYLKRTEQPSSSGFLVSITVFLN